jgi:hypothetical protein
MNRIKINLTDWECAACPIITDHVDLNEAEKELYAVMSGMYGYDDTEIEEYLQGMGNGRKREIFLDRLNEEEEAVILRWGGYYAEDEQPTLYAILTDSSLTKSEMADNAIQVIDRNIYERETLIQLVEMARDAKSNCPYVDVQYYVERYASRTLDRLCDRIALRLTCK